MAIEIEQQITTGSWLMRNGQMAEISYAGTEIAIGVRPGGKIRSFWFVRNGRVSDLHKSPYDLIRKVGGAHELFEKSVG